LTTRLFENERIVALIKKGKILFELNGIKKDIAKEAFRLGSAKLPIQTDVIERVIK